MARLGHKSLRWLLLRIFTSGCLLFLGGSIVVIFLALSRKVLSLSFFSIWTSWADFRCSWQCLGSRVGAFIIREGIWVIIFTFLFLVLLRALLRVRRRLKETSAFNERLMMIASPRRSWGIDYFIFPFLLPLALTAGLVKPKIFLSSALLKVLTQEELKTVLLHEAFHQKSRHPLKNLILSFLADLVFFLPVTNRLRKAFGLAGELRADFHGLDNGQDLSSLLSSLRKIHNFRVGPELGLSLYSPVQFNDLERLRYLSEGGLKFSWSWLRLVISFLIVLLAFFLTLAPFGESGKKLIFEHKSTCSFHTLIKEGSES